jgi:hypothetical protein
MTYFNTFALVFFSVLTLLAVLSIAREAVDRWKAGPGRFRLPLASVASTSRGGLSLSARTFLLVVCVLLMLPAAFVRRDPSSLALPLLFSWGALHTFQTFVPRRHEKRWLVLASGVIGLVMGAAVFAAGLALSPARLDSLIPGLPGPLLLVLAACFIAANVGPVREALSGTLVRERGIEFFGRTLPPSRIIVNGWQDGEGGSILRLTLRAPRLFDSPFWRDSEVSMPVPTSDRHALGAFLVGFGTNAGVSPDGGDVKRHLQTPSTGEG